MSLTKDLYPLPLELSNRGIRGKKVVERRNRSVARVNQNTVGFCESLASKSRCSVAIG